ncbi:hypothetical protein [Actinocorallia longicatena]|uniref:High-affinity nickel-transport protein n=1 Tax=Actinocorallia longicatena TaxID=111803 RepID=A0ABP6QEV8_9ACTN
MTPDRPSAVPQAAEPAVIRPAVTRPAVIQPAVARPGRFLPGLRWGRAGVWGLRVVIGVVLAVQVLLLLSTGAGAAETRRHPLGNFTTNTYDGLVIGPDAVRVEHVEDLAEIPSAQVMAELDASGDAVWADRRCRAAGQALRLVLDGRPGTLVPERATATRRDGQAGLRTLRVDCVLKAPAKTVRRVEFATGATAAGWHEITARGDRMALVSSDVPEESRSSRLTSYPADLLSSPPDRRTARLEARAGGPALTETDPALPRILPRGSDSLTRSFTSLVASHHLTPGFALLAALIAVALGALHALAPGHGKTLMAAYAISRTSRARRDVLTLGLTVTLTHTAGVLVLGLLVTATDLAPAALYPWLTLLSGLLLAAAGVTLIRRALRSRHHAHDHHHTHHPHTHHPNTRHDHAHDHDAHDHDAHDHDAHDHDAHDHDAHDHDAHDDDASHRGDDADAPSTPKPARPRAHAAQVNGPDPIEDGPSTALALLPRIPDPGQGTAPDPGRRARSASRRAPWAQSASSRAPRDRSGVAIMGFAGGMVPSPSAVLVLVGAAALGRAWFGVALVVAYGAGLAIALVGVGLLVCGPGRSLAERVHGGLHGRGGRLGERLHRLMHGVGVLPVLSAGAVVLAGLAIALRAIAGT